jgi:nucleotide-binding universal stress UspA family protein
MPALLQARPLVEAGRRRQKILVPVDGSRTCEAALAHVIALARSMPLSVHLLNVQAPIMAGDVNLFTTVMMVESQRRTAGEEVLKRARSMLTAARIEHTAEVVLGAPAAAIVRSAAVNDCAKIVMGTRTSGLLGAVLRPSVARRVVKLAPMPVTVVKPASKSGGVPGHSVASLAATLRRLCSWRKRSCASSRAYQAS